MLTIAFFSQLELVSSWKANIFLQDYIYAASMNQHRCSMIQNSEFSYRFVVYKLNVNHKQGTSQTEAGKQHFKKLSPLTSTLFGYIDIDIMYSFHHLITSTMPPLHYILWTMKATHKNAHLHFSYL
jgi:hypothetical protein